MSQSIEQTSHRPAAALLPPVDIVEDASGITVFADLPGVEPRDLSVDVDGRTLTIEAPLTLGEAKELVSVYAEVRSNCYRRSFELSSELDTMNIAADWKEGVLTLRIPRAEHAKPRKVEVRTG